MRRENDLSKVRPGATIYLSPRGNYATTYRRLPKPIAATVVDVKRKYLYAARSNISRETVAIERATGWSRDEGTNGSWFAYATREDYDRDHARERMLARIQRFFRDGFGESGLDYDTVDAIHAALVTAGALAPLEPEQENL